MAVARRVRRLPRPGIRAAGGRGGRGVIGSPEASLVRRIAWPGRGEEGWANLLSQEWLVTNGLGGYASGTVCGVPTRRFHGLLIAALPSPHGRVMMLNHLTEEVRFEDGTVAGFGGEEREESESPLPGADAIREFRLELGLPVWVYETGGLVLEKRIVLPYRQNSVYVSYRVVDGPSSIELRLRPRVHVRRHEAPVESYRGEPCVLRVVADRYEIAPGDGLPSLRLRMYGPDASFTSEHGHPTEVLYRVEESRGYDARGGLWSPGFFQLTLARGETTSLAASTEPWETVDALRADEVLAFERDRRHYLLTSAGPAAANDL